MTVKFDISLKKKCRYIQNFIYRIRYVKRCEKIKYGSWSSRKIILQLLPGLVHF